MRMRTAMRWWFVHGGGCRWWRTTGRGYDSRPKCGPLHATVANDIFLTHVIIVTRSTECNANQLQWGRRLSWTDLQSSSSSMATQGIRFMYYVRKPFFWCYTVVNDSNLNKCVVSRRFRLNSMFPFLLRHPPWLAAFSSPSRDIGQ
jgi:hypothetical protein